MEITVDLAPDVISRLQIEAELSDQPLEAYIKRLIESQVKPLKPENAILEVWGSPEHILNEAVRAMKENQIKHRELAVRAITEKNNLVSDVMCEERIITEMQRKADVATEAGNSDLAEMFLKEKTLREKTLQSMQMNLVAATEAAEKIRHAIKREEERIRVMTAEALALKVKIREARAMIVFNDALTELKFHLTDAPENLDVEWKQAFNTWIDSLDAQAKEAVRRRVKRMSVRKVMSWKSRVFQKGRK